MNTYDSLKVNSHIATNQLLIKSKPIYETDVTTKKEAESLSSLLTVLLGFAEKMDKPVSWLITDKNTLKESIISQLILFSNGIQCLADNLSDGLMLEIVLISNAEIRRLTEIKLISYTKQVLDICKDHLEELAPYGITDVEHVKLETDFVAFEQKLEDKKVLLSAKKKNKGKFDQTMKEINTLLNKKLDRRIENLRGSQLEFVNQYFSIRKTSRPAHHSYDLLGYITDTATNEPIAYGDVYIEELNMKTDITQTGAFRFKSVPEGKFHLRVENLDYKTIRVSFTRYAPEKLKLNLEMERLPVEETQPA